MPLCDEAHSALGARLLDGCLEQCLCLIAVGNHGECRAKASHNGGISQAGDHAVKLIEDVCSSPDGIGERLDREELSIVAGVREAIHDGQDEISRGLVGSHPPALLRCGLEGLPPDLDPSIGEHLLGNRHERLDASSACPVLHELPERLKSMLVRERQFQWLGFSEQLADEVVVASLEGKLSSGQQAGAALRRIDGQAGSALERGRGDRRPLRATSRP